MDISTLITRELNEQQVEAVTTVNGPMQVIAGAGSGKTRVLVHRIAYLIEQGIKPYNILALTFTNKAANEMKMRISQLVDYDSASRIWAGTFHSIFARMLRSEAHHLGYTNSFSIYDEEDAVKIIKNIQVSSQISNKQYAPKVIYSAISSAKNRLIHCDEYANSAITPFEKHISELYRLYQSHLLYNNAMDFDDLLCNTVHLFEIQEVVEKYQNRFKYILVDEYQDTNHVQYKAIKRLAAHHQNLCVVGDDAQSIYKWRGADIKNMLDFEKDYPYCKTIKLEQNYRSTKNILRAAHSVISNNKRQLQKKLWTDNDEGDLVKLMKLADDKMEAAAIIETIKKQVMAGEKLNEFAVLYRINAQSLAFENTCRVHNIPYVVVGGMSFYKRKEVKDVLAYLKILINPHDSTSILRVINEPPRGIGEASVNALISYATSRNMPLYHVLHDFENTLDKPKGRSKAAIEKFSSIMKKYSELAQNSSDTDYLFDYIEDTGMLEYYREIDSEESRDRLANIEQLLNDITAYINEAPDRNLQSYIEQASLVSDLDTKDFSGEKLTLMTVHSAKGLEFNHVFISGMEENLFPLHREFSDYDIEEERRLFYVGITRAKKTLALAYAAKRLKFGKIFHNKHSNFLTEIEPEVICDVYNNSFLATKKKFSFDSSVSIAMQPKKNFPVFDDLMHTDNYSQLPENDITYITYRIGDTVKHSTFGIGKILNISGINESKKITVHFNSVGRKQLLLQFAKLEIVK